MQLWIFAARSLLPTLMYIYPLLTHAWVCLVGKSGPTAETVERFNKGMLVFRLSCINGILEAFLFEESTSSRSIYGTQKPH